VPSLILSLSTGIAYTIDPAYEAEVRDYLGESDSPNDVAAIQYVFLLMIPLKITEKRYA